MPTNRNIIDLPLSKSMCNRALILDYVRGLFPNRATALSSSGDSLLLFSLLDQLHRRQTSVFDCGNAGTTARFLTALLATEPGEWILTGSKRMKERPIAPLVDALRALGASISYTETTGAFPLHISGSSLSGTHLKWDATESSQFLSALMLIANRIDGEVVVEYSRQQSSTPYPALSQAMITLIGGEIQKTANGYRWQQPTYNHAPLTIERDWSSASYFYGFVSLLPSSSLFFPKLSLESYQGDRILSTLFATLGVETQTEAGGIAIRNNSARVSSLEIDCCDFPDLVQTLAVVAALHQIPTCLKGIANLRHKETNRIDALVCELSRLGYSAIASADTLTINPSAVDYQSTIAIETYDDHRMLMSFALCCTKFPNITLKNPDSAKKSFPSFVSQFCSLLQREPSEIFV